MEWFRQLGWWHSAHLWKNKANVPNHQSDLVDLPCHSKMLAPIPPWSGPKSNHLGRSTPRTRRVWKGLGTWTVPFLEENADSPVDFWTISRCKKHLSNMLKLWCSNVFHVFFSFDCHGFFTPGSVAILEKTDRWDLVDWDGHQGHIHHHHLTEPRLNPEMSGASHQEWALKPQCQHVSEENLPDGRTNWTSQSTQRGEAWLLHYEPTPSVKRTSRELKATWHQMWVGPVYLCCGHRTLSVFEPDIVLAEV